MTENKRYLIVDSNFVPEGKYIKDNKTKHTFPTTTRIATLIMYEQVLNEQEKEIQELKQRNQRQYERLKELTDLMFKRDWKTLETMVDEWEKEEEQLQKYGG